VASQEALEERVAVTTRFGDAGAPAAALVGYRVLREQIEFWQDRPFRLHTASLYSQARRLAQRGCFVMARSADPTWRPTQRRR
jgi:pyridoxine/pyridoxamine 5'-phosphate oxidase